MAGVCALQANPHTFSRDCGCTTKLSCHRCRLSASEHETCFENAAWLICALTSCPEAETWRHTSRVNNSQVSAKEECISAIRGRHGERKRAAARTVEQVDGIGVTCGGDIFNPGRQRKPAFEVVSHQERAAASTRTLGDSDLRVRGYIRDLD